MKKYALLAGLYLILFVSSCSKDNLEMEVKNIDLELIKMDKKANDQPKVNNWDKIRPSVTIEKKEN